MVSSVSTLGGEASGRGRLGDILLKQNAVSREDLENAIESQVLYGGRLGTNLLEMGVVDIAALAKCLSLQYQVPTVDAATTRNISSDVVALMPIKIAQKRQAVPVKLEGRSLYVVFADPSNFEAVDEVSFTTGKNIIPLVAPEVVVFVLLERLYNIKRDHRYATISLAPRKKVEEIQAEGSQAGYQHSEIKGLSFGADEELISEDEFDNLINAYSTKDDVVLDLLDEADDVALNSEESPAQTLIQPAPAPEPPAQQVPVADDHVSVSQEIRSALAE